MTATLPGELSRYLSSVLAHCLDIRTVWSIGDADVAPQSSRALYELLLFADARTLHAMRRNHHLHRADVQALVVIDGEQFENAWGPYRLSGSLARWAWRQVAPDVAYYDESRWAEREGTSGRLVRVRRKAVLIWSTSATRIAVDLY